jgi:WD40 repeat protein
MTIMNRSWPTRLLWYSVLSITSVVSSGALCDEEKQRAETSQEILTFKGHADWVTSVAFSPDGKWIASASNDHTLKVWNAKTGREMVTLKGHTKPVTQLTISPDGQRLASSSDDGTVKVWDARRFVVRK